jgi:hypothetical protein
MSIGLHRLETATEANVATRFHGRRLQIGFDAAIRGPNGDEHAVQQQLVRHEHLEVARVQRAAAESNGPDLRTRQQAPAANRFPLPSTNSPSTFANRPCSSINRPWLSINFPWAFVRERQRRQQYVTHVLGSVRDCSSTCITLVTALHAVTLVTALHAQRQLPP